MLDHLYLDIMDGSPLCKPLLTSLDVCLPSVKEAVVLVGGLPEVDKGQDDLTRIHLIHFLHLLNYLQ